MDVSHLTKIGHNEFRVDFKTNVRDDIVKTVIVEGEEYTKTIRNTYEFDSIKDFEASKRKNMGIQAEYHVRIGNWHKEEISEFVPINGEIYYVWNYYGFCSDPTNRLDERISENGHVNLIYSIYKKMHINGIRSIYTNKTKSRYNDELKYMLKRRAVSVPIYNYGYNNTVFAEINLFRFIKMNFIGNKYIPSGSYKSELYRTLENLIQNYPDIFPKKLLRGGISELEYNDMAINFLNKSINYKFSTI